MKPNMKLEHGWGNTEYLPFRKTAVLDHFQFFLFYFFIFILFSFSVFSFSFFLLLSSIVICTRVDYDPPPSRQIPPNGGLVQLKS